MPYEKQNTQRTTHMTTKLIYIKQSAIRKYAKSHGKRVSSEFLSALDRYLEQKVFDSAKEHNGGKKTLDVGLAAYMLGKR